GSRPPDDGSGGGGASGSSEGGSGGNDGSGGMSLHCGVGTIEQDGGCVKQGPSCTLLAPTCGPAHGGGCCLSSIVEGGTFYRSYDAITFADKSFPATVSDFRLDTYEITVGRFRKFVAAYSQDMIPVGAGKNPNNPSDVGWDVAYNSLLPAD